MTGAIGRRVVRPDDWRRLRTIELANDLGVQDEQL